MAHPHTYPTLFDEVLTISITKLKEWNYFEPGYRSGVINWSINGNKTASINIALSITDVNPFVELNYSANGKPINYKIELTTLPSNLGCGKIWYFVCPHTGKRARKLYNIGGKFLHRTAFIGCMYEIQTLSKKSRQNKKAMDGFFIGDKIPTRYFRPYYKGKPTRTLKRILRKQKQAEGFTLDQLF